MMIIDSQENVPTEFQEFMDIVSQVDERGCFSCPECGNLVEPDGKCFCGAENPLIEGGFI